MRPRARCQVLRRKEAKDYGTKKMVEGVYAKGAKCVSADIAPSCTRAAAASGLRASAVRAFAPLEPVRGARGRKSRGRAA